MFVSALEFYFPTSHRAFRQGALKEVRKQSALQVFLAWKPGIFSALSCPPRVFCSKQCLDILWDSVTVKFVRRDSSGRHRSLRPQPVKDNKCRFLWGTKLVPHFYWKERKGSQMIFKLVFFLKTHVGEYLYTGSVHRLLELLKNASDSLKLAEFENLHLCQASRPGFYTWLETIKNH